MNQKSYIGLLLLVAISASAATYLCTRSKQNLTVTQAVQPPQNFAENQNTASCGVNLVRINSSELVRPLLMAESESESPELSQVKQEVQKTIATFTASGKVSRASVYLKELNNGKWFQINGYDFYYPGSLVKVPILITFLKMAEKEPGLLQEEITLVNPVSNQLIQSTHGDKLVQGKSYPIEKLLHEMIVYSDNDATSALIERIDKPTFLKLYKDLGLQTPDLYDMNFKTSPAEYNRFLRILYNASYLSTTASEYALDLLTKAVYDKGIRSQIPENILVAHKFGERPADNGFCLHDAAVVYSKTGPYTVVVMTEGKAMPDLELLIQDITKAITNHIQ